MKSPSKNTIAEPLLQKFMADNNRFVQRLTRLAISFIIPSYVLSTALFLGFGESFIMEFAVIWVFGVYFCAFAFVIDHLTNQLRRLRDQERLEELLLMPYSLKQILQTFVVYHGISQRSILIPSFVLQFGVIAGYFGIRAYRFGMIEKAEIDMMLVLLITTGFLFVVTLISVKFYIYQILNSMIRVGISPPILVRAFVNRYFLLFVILMLLFGVGIVGYVEHYDHDDIALMFVFGMIFCGISIYRAYLSTKEKILDSWDAIKAESILEVLSGKS